MISEQVFYLFLFPWIVFIAAVPGSVMTYIFAGLAAQLLNYLPEKTGDENNESDVKQTFCIVCHPFNLCSLEET